MQITVETTARQAIDKLEKEFARGAVVEMIEGNAIRPFAMIRKTKSDNVLVPLLLGRMSDSDYEQLLAWHSRKWEQLLKNKKFRLWAKKHPIPNAE